MQKLLISLVLTLSAFAAQAQSCIWRSWWTPTGAGTALAHGTAEAVGVRVAWATYWCPLPDNRWEVVLQRCVVGRGCLDHETLIGLLDTAGRSTNPMQSLRDARAMFAREPLSTELPAWYAAEREAAAAAAALYPPNAAASAPRPALVVGAATRADGTRPAYRYTAGVRGTTQVPPGATAGQPCGTVFQATSAGSWATFGPSFVPDLGTLCVKAP
jgi:hypothetical protein